MFGRRSSRAAKRNAAGIPPHPGPDADGVTRVIPKEIWDGPQGDFLREIGASPDDPANLMPTQDQVQARFDKLREEQDVFAASLNKQMPEGVTVVPWAMIPWTVWRQRHAAFLLSVCDLYPVGCWNTLMLPEDEHGAMVLGLPRHLGGLPDGLEDAADRVIGEIREKFAQSCDRTGAALARSELASLAAHEKAKDEAIAMVMRLAHALGATTYGDDAYARHEKLFGATLGWSITNS